MESTLLNWLGEHAASDQAGSEADYVHELINRCLRGESAAFDRLYQQFAGMIYRLNYTMLNNREDAEEVLQDSFEYAFRRLDTFDPSKSAFKTWLYRIAISRCRNKRRRKWLPTFSLQQMITGGRDVADQRAVVPEDNLQFSQERRAVWECIQQLSPKLKEVALLRYYDELPYKDIGEILDISPKTAESRMRLAHKSLRDALIASE